MIDNGIKRRNPNSGVRRSILSSRLHGRAKLAPTGVQAARRVTLEGVIETDGGPVTGAVCDELGGAESGLLVRHLLRQQRRFHAISDLQLLQDVGHVMLDRLFAQIEGSRDLFVTALLRPVARSSRICHSRSVRPSSGLAAALAPPGPSRHSSSRLAASVGLT